MVKIEIWKKIIAVVGVMTQTIGFLISSPTLVVVGSASLTLGVVLMFIAR